MTNETQQLIHYTDHHGVEPAIVLIHGFSCDESDWANQVRWCRENGRRVITVDLRSHGKSTQLKSSLNMTTMASDVVAILQSIGVQSAIVAGHSMGCRVATEVAIQYPEAVVGVALVDGSRLTRGKDKEVAIAAFQTKIDQIGFDKFASDLFDTMFLPNADQVQKEMIVKRASAMPSDVGMKVFISLLQWDTNDFDRCYSQIAVPIQVVQSTHIKSTSEGIVPVTPSTVVQWHGEVEACGANAVFELVEECGHFTMLDKPDVVNASLGRLLARVQEKKQ